MVSRATLVSLVRCPAAALRGLAGRFWRDRRGNYSMMVALLLPVLTAFVGIGTETGMWLYDQQTQQATTDAAAFSAATFYATKESGPPTSTDLSNAETQAFAVAANYGFTSAGCQGGSTTCTPTCTGSGTTSSCSFPANCTPASPGTGSFCVQVNFWPKTGPFSPANNNATPPTDAFEVKVAQSPQQLFSKVLNVALFGSSGFNPVIIQARSVGIIKATSGPGGTVTTPCNSASCVCVKVTSIINAAGSAGLSGTSAINLNGCSLEVDDPNSSALQLSGSTTVSAGDIYLANAGDAFSKSGTASLSGTLEALPSPTGNITSASGSCTMVTSVASTTNISVGMTVTDSSGGIPAGTTVTAINGSTLTLSACATKTVTADALSFTFTDPYTTQEAGNLYTGGPVTIPTITATSSGGCGSATSDTGNLTTNITGSSTASYPTNSRFYTSVGLSGAAARTIQPGVYYICPSGSVSLSGTVSLSTAPFASGGTLTEGSVTCTSPYLACNGVVPYQNGDGVTFVLLGLTNITTGAVTNCASFTASGSSALNLVPPNSGPFSGILITSSPNCTAPSFGSASGAETLSISGSSTQNLFGAINLPQYALSYSGTSSATSSGCLNIIANSLRISGTAGLANNCTGVGTTGVGPSTTNPSPTGGPSTYSAALGN
jgi:Flp pilus assembly protein TadG